MKAIGLSFAHEIETAGLIGLPFSWTSEGAINFSELMTEAQKATVLAVYSSHNPLTLIEPTPIESIRALEAPFDDAFKKVQRQFLIASLLKDACARPEAAGLTEAQVHEALMLQGKTYAKLYLLEQSIIPFRELLP